MKPFPPSLVPVWWKRALDDGCHCERKRRERYFHEYLIDAEEALTSAGLIPVQDRGLFLFWYRRGFKLGYDNAKLQRERGLPRRKKRAKLG